MRPSRWPTIDGAADLTITTSGLTTLGGVVGPAVTSLTTNGGGTTAINTPTVTTTGLQNYTDAVTLGVAATAFDLLRQRPDHVRQHAERRRGRDGDHFRPDDVWRGGWTDGDQPDDERRRHDGDQHAHGDDHRPARTTPTR